MLVYVPGTCISPFVVALEGGVNSNRSSRERFLRTANPRQDPNSCVHGRHEACCRTQEERGVAAYRRTPEREQNIFYPNHLLVIGGNEARPQYLQSADLRCVGHVCTIMFYFCRNLTDVCLCLLYTSPSPRDLSTSRMPSSA